VDKGTFIRFTQFAYIGEYSISKGSTAQAVMEAESSLQEPRVLEKQNPQLVVVLGSTSVPQDTLELAHFLQALFRVGCSSNSGALL
jgi:hypothetical protein